MGITHIPKPEERNSDRVCSECAEAALKREKVTKMLYNKHGLVDCRLYNGKLQMTL